MVKLILKQFALKSNQIHRFPNKTPRDDINNFGDNKRGAKIICNKKPLQTLFSLQGLIVNLT